MERTSQVISDTLYKKFIDSKISISQNIESYNFSYKHSFKYAVLNESSIHADALSATEFCIYEGSEHLPSATGIALNEARYTDFMLGSSRVKIHYDDLSKAKDANISSAWLVVTAYYCCFFHA